MPIKSQKADIARIIMKEHNKECIKYFPVKEGETMMPVNRRIPRDELEEYLSQEYKDLVKKMRG
jgi:hypothetical protein